MTDRLQVKVERYIALRAHWLSLCEQIEMMKTEREDARTSMEEAHAEMESAVRADSNPESIAPPAGLKKLLF